MARATHRAVTDMRTVVVRQMLPVRPQVIGTQHNKQASKQASKQAYQDSITKGAGTHINLLTSRHIVAMVSIDGEPKIAHSVEVLPQQ